MEHRHHRHDAVARGQRQPVRLVAADGMQHDGAVRILHPLGIAGRARGIAHRRRRALVDLGPGMIRVAGFQQFVIEQHPLDPRRHLVAGAEHDQMLHRIQMGADRGHQRQEGGIEHDHLVPGMIGDIGDLFGRQAGVDRMGHPPAAGHAEIDLQMAAVVPGDGADTRTGRHAQPIQRRGQPARMFRHPRPIAARDLARGLDRDHLGAAVKARRVVDQRVHRQLLIHHLAGHDHAPPLADCSIRSFAVLLHV